MATSPHRTERGRATPGVDNLRGRIALDVEWNAKDGNLDRDLAAYRALYDMGFVDGAVLITRSVDDLRQLATRLAGEPRLDTATTTNMVKLRPRMTRGDPGGCPLLAIGITARCWDEHASTSTESLLPRQPGDADDDGGE